MKLTFMQFYFSVMKQEEEVNNNIEEILQTLLRRDTTKIRSYQRRNIKTLKSVKVDRIKEAARWLMIRYKNKQRG